MFSRQAELPFSNVVLAIAPRLGIATRKNGRPTPARRPTPGPTAPANQTASERKGTSGHTRSWPDVAEIIRVLNTDPVPATRKDEAVAAVRA